MSSVNPIFYYRIVISMIRCNFLQSLTGDVTFLQGYISTFTPALGGIWAVTIPAPRAPVPRASRGSGGMPPPPPENFAIVSAECEPGLLIYCH